MLHKSRKMLALSVFSLVFFFLSGCNDVGNSGETKYVNIGTAGTGGAYYPIGIAMSEILSKNLNVNSSAQITGGAVENVTLVNDGEVEIAITQSPIALAGFNGTVPFENKHENIATLFNGLSKGVFHTVVSESSGIQTLADLKGKKVVLGPSGGGAINVVQDVLSVYGIKIDDLNATYVSYDEGISMLSDNNVDAVIVQSAAPASSIKELAVTGKKFKILSIEQEKIQEILEKFTYLSDVTIPKEMYETPEEISTVYLTNMVIVKRDLDEETVYQITKTIFDNIDTVRESHPSAKELSLESAAARPPIPLHPGAEKYFKEKGVLK